MANDTQQGPSDDAWTLRKSVSTLAIAPHTESITRTARLAYNVMIFKAQRMIADEEGGYSAPLSEILMGFGSTTRDAARVQGYIEQMCTTLVRRFTLAPGDDTQAVLDGFAPASPQDAEEGRVFTLLSEARFSRRAGERWVTWFFPPTIRGLIIDPTRWARIDIKELASLSHYAGVALYEICSRYKDAPGSLTNRAEPAWWVAALRPDSETKPREWRKFKNETLKPALTEISQRTSLTVELIEHKKGRTVGEVQFRVKHRQLEPVHAPVDLGLVAMAGELGVKERDLDPLVDEMGEARVRDALQLMADRKRNVPAMPIKHPLAYLKNIARRGAGSMFDDAEAKTTAQLAVPSGAVRDGAKHKTAGDVARVLPVARDLELAAEVDELSAAEVEHYARIAHQKLSANGMLTPSIKKRFDAKQFTSPLIRQYIKEAYAEDQYGADWRTSA